MGHVGQGGVGLAPGRAALRLGRPVDAGVLAAGISRRGQEEGQPVRDILGLAFAEGPRAVPLEVGGKTDRVVGPFRLLLGAAVRSGLLDLSDRRGRRNGRQVASFHQGGHGGIGGGGQLDGGG